MPLEIQEGYTSTLREKLNSGDLDAIIISQPFSAAGIVTRDLYKEPFVVLMPASHPLAKFKTVNEEALSEYNVLMLGEGHCFRDQVISSCPKCFLNNTAGVNLNWHTVEASSLETIRHMIAAGMGLTILPMTAANSGAYRSHMLTTRPLKGSHPNRVISLAWRHSFPRIKTIDAIIKALIKCQFDEHVITLIK
jgi:LysR family hydrogen peroxide-inducible transcriptional activator